MTEQERRRQREREAREAAARTARSAPPAPYNPDLAEVARRQLGVLLFLLASVVFPVVYFALKPVTWPALLASTVPMTVAATMGVFLLAGKVYGRISVAVGVLALIPGLSLAVLLVVNRRATLLLREHDYRVGVLGAAPAEFREFRPEE